MTQDFPNAFLSTSPFRQACLSSLLMFLAGSTFSLGVFTPSVEAGAHPPHALDGTWEIAMGAMHFLSAPIMMVTGLYLDAGRPESSPPARFPSPTSNTFRVRLLVLVSLCAFAGLALAAAGAAYSSTLPVFAGVSLQAFPLGIVYLLCTELQMAWYPHRSALAVACGQSAFGLGTIVLTRLFSELIVAVNHVSTLYLAAGTLAIAAVLPMILMRWPAEGEVAAAGELLPLRPHAEQVEKISWPRLLRLSNFWLYILAVFSTSIGYMFNPYFFKLGMLFGRPMKQLVLVFNVTDLVATVCCLFCTASTDFFTFGSGFWFSGAKNMMMLFMSAQVLLMFSMIAVNNMMSFPAFVAVKALIRIIMTSHVGCAAILTKDLFGAKNTATVFGFGAGLALGCGEAGSAWLMAAVEALVGNIKGPSDYNPFYWIAGLWSFGGLVCTILVQRHENADKSIPVSRNDICSE